MRPLDTDTRQRLLRARQVIVDTYMAADSNICGVGIGYRQRQGQWTDEPSVAVFVVRKRPAGHVSSRKLLPRSVDVDGTPAAVDVIESGRATAFTKPATAPVRSPARVRPVRTGASIGHVDITTGTMGCLVRDGDSLQILSNNHVLANQNNASPGDPILQPGTADGGSDPTDTVAELTRFVPVRFGELNTVDAAIARPLSDDLVSELVMGDLMPPVGPGHPAVGLLFAGTCLGWIFANTMDQVLSELDVSMLHDGASASPTLGMTVEKVGRTSDYTSSMVVATDLIVAIGYDSGIAFFSETFAIPLFGGPGDSGSIICAGGSGEDFYVGDCLAYCIAAAPVGDMYDLPLSDDVAFADRVRDEFLALTTVGRLVNSVFYLNQQMVRDRTDGVEASDVEKAYAKALYDRWIGFAKWALDNPRDPTAVVTQKMLDDTQLAFQGLLLRTTEEEGVAVRALYHQVIKQTLGMNYDQLLAYLSREDVFWTVWDILAAVPTIILGRATIARR